VILGCCGRFLGACRLAFGLRGRRCRDPMGSQVQEVVLTELQALSHLSGELEL
jgi:hypothetical protein